MVIMFEVLMFIFENYMDGNVSLRADNQTMVVELENVGLPVMRLIAPWIGWKA